MILAHLIIGAMPIEDKFSWYWFLGSVIPDIDHVFIIFKNRIFSIEKLLDTIANEEKYGIRYKSKYLHSFLGAIVLSSIIIPISHIGAALFFSGYCVHLLLDFPDKDEKQYFYPFKKKFFGWFPIFSKFEIVFTIMLLGIVLGQYI